MNELIIKFAPYYHFDSLETSYPLDINTFLENRLNFNVVNAYVREIDSDTQWLYYICFYLYDNGTKCCLPFNCYCTDIQFSEHEYDFEIVLIELKNEKINRVCFCPHGVDENFWIDNTSSNGLLKIIDAQNSNKIHVYISRHKHASYPLDGTIWRYGGFANDYNDNRVILKLTPILLTQESIDSQLFQSKKKCLFFDYNSVKTLSSVQSCKYHMFLGS